MTPKAEQDEQAPTRALFRRRHRIAGGEFADVFDAKLRKSSGPITLHLRPNGLGEHRLGLSVGRRLGNAVVRGRFKRTIREIFRLSRQGLPAPSAGGAYDIVVSVRPHDAAGYEAYRGWFLGAIDAAHRVHEKRGAAGGPAGQIGGQAGERDG